MNLFTKLFGGNAKEARLEVLVGKLMAEDEATFLGGLREAVTYAPRGDDFGLRAMSEAIRRRSGKSQVEFYEPSLGGLTVRHGSELMQIEDRLLDLALKRALLADPATTQNLISAGLSFLGHERLKELALEISSLGGVEQFFGFQLLYNQMQSSIKLRHARGERSWTEKMQE